MIKIIGLQKVLMIAVFAGLLVLAVGYKTYVLDASNTTLVREVGGKEGELSTMYSNIADLRASLEKFEAQKEQFKTVAALGFFDPQDRVDTRTRINLLQRESRLISARYTLSPVVIEQNKKAAEAKQKVLFTEIKFDLEAIDDADIYSFIKLLNYGFPGNIKITSFNMKRDGELNYPTLRKIGSGGGVSLVQATLHVEWRTMVDVNASMGSSFQGGN